MTPPFNEIPCPRCQSTIHGGRRFCPSCGLLISYPNAETVAIQVSRDTPVELMVGDYALSADLLTSEAVSRVPLLPSIVESVITHWQKPLKRAALMGGAVRVTETQIPSLHDLLQRCAFAIGVKCPELFVVQDPTFDARTLGTNDDAIVYLHSGLIDALREDELAFVLSHELGHIKSRHVTYQMVAYCLSNGLVSFWQAAVAPLTLALESWSRQAELTADRAGLLGCGAIAPSLRALLMLALGSRKLLPELSIEEFIEQDKEVQGAYGKLNLWLSGYDHPYLSTRARALVEFAGTARARQLARLVESRVRAATPVCFAGPKTTADSAQARLSPGLLEAQSMPLENEFCQGCGFEMPNSMSVCPICGTHA